jgi:hypothetical protein
MKNKILFTVFILATIFTLNSCKKEGCTDSEADNFCTECKKADNSCRFSGSIVFWFNQTAANGLVNDGATVLYYYVNGNLVGSTASNLYWSSAPNCGQSGSITVKKDLGSSKSLTESYVVKDQTGFTYWNGTVNYLAGKCNSVELLW